MAMSPAMESIFANAQQNAASLIETATLAINAKVNTIEEAEKMIQDLSSEAVKFNELLNSIVNAMRQVESGDMTKEEAAGIIAPAVKELKDKCCALKIANVEAPGDDITEDEIAILRELIIGAKAAAEDRLVAIRLGDDDKIDPEIEAEINTPDEDKAEESIEVAIEGKIGDAFKKHKENKAKINTLWDSFKDKRSEAILAQFAKAAAPKCTGKADIKAFVAEMISEDEKSGKDYTGKLSAKDYIVKSYSGITMAIMPGNPDKTGCGHILAPIHDDAGDCFFFKREICNIMLNPAKKETPAQESNNIIENKNNESESKSVMENYSEFMYACESMMNELMLELATGAMEAEGANGEESGAPSTIASKLKSGFSKLKSAVKHGDKKAADEATSEIKEEANKLAEVSDEDPKKDKMSTAAKVGLVAAAGVAATIGLANLGIAMKNSADKKGVSPKGAAAQIIKAASAINKACDKNKFTRVATIAAGTVSGGVLGSAAAKSGPVKKLNDKIEAKYSEAYNKAEEKKQARRAKKAADAAAEAFGLESYDVYEVIQEFFAPDQIDMNDVDAATEAAIEFTYVMEEVYENLEVATESQSWQAVKGILGEKSRAARKAVKAGKKAAKAEAVAKFKEAKELFGEQKAALQKLPKDMWDTISSWLSVGWIPLIYSFIGEGGYKDAPNKNVNVAAVINYLNRAMKKCDELAANAGKGEAPAEESLDAAMAAMLESFGNIQDDIDAAIAADMQ